MSLHEIAIIDLEKGSLSKIIPLAEVFKEDPARAPAEAIPRLVSAFEKAKERVTTLIDEVIDGLNKQAEEAKKKEEEKTEG